jgi:hypothetical protein
MQHFGDGKLAGREHRYLKIVPLFSAYGIDLDLGRCSLEEC